MSVMAWFQSRAPRSHEAAPQLGQVERVCAHHQALAQCRQMLDQLVIRIGEQVRRAQGQHHAINGLARSLFLQKAEKAFPFGLVN